LPVSGRFSAEQRLIYDLVYKAQRAALAMLRPGIEFMAPNREAMRVLTEGLCELGILKVKPEFALQEDQQLYRRYTLHNISHMLGLDVHDCPAAKPESYKAGKLRPGMVFSCEPGLYFQKDDLTVPERFRGIGIRIEEDVLVTSDGHRNLTAAVPAKADDVEAWMERIWRESK
jgi:Xaa-Pro aminopeptidase